jgi:hypothetical protein
MSKQPRSRVEESGDRPVAIYHRVYAEEGFDTAAQMLFDLDRRAQTHSPGAERALYLDIDGHRNQAGGFDTDMLELQQHFVLGFLMQFLTEVNMPLAAGARRQDGSRQSDDLPETLLIRQPGRSPMNSPEPPPRSEPGHSIVRMTTAIVSSCRSA